MTLSLVPRGATDKEFVGIYNRLCVALREPQDDTGITQGVYFDALRDVPLEALKAGAEALEREPGRRFFPTTAEWRTAAQAWQASRQREAATVVDRVAWRYECLACDDTGYELVHCGGGAVPDVTLEHVDKGQVKGRSWFYKPYDGPEAVTCGRKRAHAPHRYVRVCPCRPTNRTFQRHHGGYGGE